MPFSLEIEIASHQFEWLRAKGYKLCIARRVNNVYTVAWDVTEILIERPGFEWMDEFQTFWVRDMKSPPQVVKPGCNPVAIACGQSVTIKPNTSMEPALGTPNVCRPVAVYNNGPHPFHIGLTSKLNGEWKTFYVTPKKLGHSGKILEISPNTEAIKVWFKDQTTSELIQVDENAFEVIYPGPEQKTISYDGEVPGAGNFKDGGL